MIVTSPYIVERDLIDALVACEAKVYRLVAPAGFGKSFMAAQIARRFPKSAVCDCLGVRETVALAQRLIAAFSMLAGEHGRRIKDEAMSLAFSSVDDRRAYLEQLWEVFPECGVLIVENVEEIVAHREALALLATLFAKRPRGSLVLCSRNDVPLRWSDALFPHENIAVREQQLLFSMREFAALFAGSAVSSGEINHLYAWTGGWPFAATQVARYMREGSDIHGLVGGGNSPQELADMLLEQLLRSLPEDLRIGAVRCAAIKQPRAEDLAEGSDALLARAFADRLVSAVPFLTRRIDGTYELHPIARAAIARLHGATFDDTLGGVIANARRRGDHLRCAELHLQRGDEDEAAHALVRMGTGTMNLPEPRYLAVLERLGRSVLIRFPELWALSSIYWENRFGPLAGEVREIVARLPQSVPLETRAACIAIACYHLADRGEWQEAFRLLDSFEISRLHDGTTTDNDDACAFIALFRAYGAISNGNEYDDAEFWQRYGSAISRSDIVLTEHYTTEARMAFLRGRPGLATASIERMVAAARRTRYPTHARIALGKAIWMAWLFGDDEALERYRTELLALLRDPFVPDDLAACEAQQMLDASWGLPWSGAERTMGDVFSLRMMYAAAVPEENEAFAALEEACRIAGATRSFWGVTLAYTALACFDPERIALLDEALRYGERCDFLAYREALAAVREHHVTCGSLTRFVQRFREAGERARKCVHVDLLRRRLRRNGEVLRLGKRELELVLLLAARGQSVQRMELADAFWPVHDEDTAFNALRVCVNRVREHTRSKELIVATAGDYALSPEIACVDLDVAERYIELAERGSVAAIRAITVLFGDLPEDIDVPASWGAPATERIRALRARAARAVTAVDRNYDRAPAELTGRLPSDGQLREDICSSTYLADARKDDL